MLPERLKKLLTTNWHFIGVVLFFIVHGYSEHAGMLPVAGLLLLLLKLLVAGMLLFGISIKLFKSQRKAGLFTSAVFVLVLFFGVFQQAITAFRPLLSVGRLLVFFPLTLVVILLLFVLLKRTKRPLNKPLLFINVLLLAYILVDIGRITLSAIDSAVSKEQTTDNYTWIPCDSCHKPPVYLVLLDSYFGSAGMKEFFGYDNGVFDGFLQQQGFRLLKNTHSNYNYTLYSMCSMLNMQYMDVPATPVIEDYYTYKKGVDGIFSNAVVKRFKNEGYQVVNYSNFDIAGIPAGYESGLLPDKIKLLNRQTMYYQAEKFLPLFLARSGWAPQLKWEIANSFVINNERMMASALADTRQKTSKPVFTYLHLMLPHSPFVYDSLGNKLPFAPGDALPPVSVINQRFLQYEVYANKRITDFITRLKQLTAGKAVIVLMSDHGYQFAMQKEKSLGFQNLNAIYLPGQNAMGWYDGMTNVNQFRILFNTLFRQQMPMLKDSIVY